MKCFYLMPFVILLTQIGLTVFADEQYTGGLRKRSVNVESGNNAQQQSFEDRQEQSSVRHNIGNINNLNNPNPINSINQIKPTDVDSNYHAIQIIRDVTKDVDTSQQQSMQYQMQDPRQQILEYQKSLTNLSIPHNIDNQKFDIITNSYYSIEYNHPFSAAYSITDASNSALGNTRSNTYTMPLIDRSGGVALYIGKKILHFMRLEYGLSYTAMYISDKVYDATGQSQRAFHMIMPEVNLLFDIVNLDTFSLFIGGGGGYGIVDQVFGTDSSVKTTSKTNLIVGVDIKRSKAKSYYISYKATNVNPTIFSIPGDIQNSEPLNLTYQSIVFGVKFNI